MRRTLFYIPHEIADVTVFGWGWALLIWLLITGGALVISVRRRGWNRETRGQLPMILLVAAAIVFVIPRVEEPIHDAVLTIPPIAASSGLPIRGYGVMLLLAVVCSVALALWRAERAGLGSDVILSLAFVLVVGGIVGARLFFVVQYWSLIQGDTWRQTLANIVGVDRGGLVVYGSLIGAVAAFLVFCSRYRISPLPLADLVAPSLALGLAMGRIGCLLNGCCFGGTCDHPWAMTFPAGSPPYVDQKGWGEFHGLRLSNDTLGRVVIQHVDPQGPFAATPLKVGDPIVAINRLPLDDLRSARFRLEAAGPELSLTRIDGSTVHAVVGRLPPRSRPIHPVQIYSAINALLLGLLALVIYPFRRRHGQVVVTLFSLYAVTRFLLEMIRIDEGEWVATLTISQNISVLVVGVMAALWVYVYRQPVMDDPSAASGPDKVDAAAV